MTAHARDHHQPDESGPSCHRQPRPRQRCGLPTAHSGARVAVAAVCGVFATSAGLEVIQSQPEIHGDLAGGVCR